MVREDTLTLMELFMKAVGMIIKWKDLVKWYILAKNLGIQGVGWIIKGMVMEHCTQITNVYMICHLCKEINIILQ